VSDPTAQTSIAIPADHGAAVVIDIDAVVANYRSYQQLAAPVAVAASLKADAYGLGAAKVAPALAAAGCEVFFVALPSEGIALRNLLPRACIVVLNGAEPDSASLFLRYRLSPALNSLEQIAGWRRLAAAGGKAEPAVLHLDTGMSRLGLTPAEVTRLATEPERLAGIRLQCVLSHLACADEPDSPMNARQRDAFLAAATALEPATGRVPRSLANSSGAFLGPDYHFDLIRPGAGLYGINPTPRRANPMRTTVGLFARVLQIREIDAPQTVGYGAAHHVTRPSRIATVAIGYADGYMRAVGTVAQNGGPGRPAAASRGRSVAFVGGTAVPVVGRVSMDLITLDVTALAPVAVQPGTIVELMGEHVPVDELAGWAGTIGYEVLTGLGSRLHRVYIGGAL
jgi:alanine racemase